MADENNREILAAGMMSGTSLDGIDVALVKSDGRAVSRFGTPFHMAYTDDEKQALRNGLAEARAEESPTAHNELINQLEVMITNRHAHALMAALEQNNLKNTDVDVVGFHGQTLLHNSVEGWSWQIGNGATLAKKVNIVVVNDFRRFDVEHGGQGAPFAPIYHHAIVAGRDLDYPVALLNIGGVANMTWIGSGDEEQLIAFDTGPGNALLDDWVQKHVDVDYDKDGMFSASGVADDEMVARWMENIYFDLAPPKSLDRNDFDVRQVAGLSLEDGAATLCTFSVAAIKRGEAKCPAPIKNWYVCGGGVHNPTIMKMLSGKVAGSVNTVEELGCDADFIEAEAFAYMAVRTLYNLPISFTGTTGISQPSCGGIANKP